MRRRSTRHPMVSFALFLVLCSMGWATWTYRDELKSEGEVEVADTVIRDRVEEAILDEFSHDACFFDLRGRLNWRPNERRYRLDFVIETTEACERQARSLCKRIAQLINAETDVVATVIAFDASGREVGRYVM